MATDNDNRSALGPWVGADWEATVSEYTAGTVDADFPDNTRFVAGVAQLVRRRLANPTEEAESDDLGIAIFVLAPKPPAFLSNVSRVPMVDTGLTRVTGRLWFTPAAVVSAHYVELSRDTDDDERFTYIADELKLGSNPTLVLEQRTPIPQLRWYPKGLSEPDVVETKPLSGDVNPNDVFGAIDTLYRECFVTPSGLPQQMNLWTNASRFRPLRNAEALLQSYLKAGLVMKFPHCKVRHEQPQLAGRTDLEIEQAVPGNPSTFVRHAIIELKVLRSYWSSGESVSAARTEEWIKEGVEQAAAYRQEKSARWSALCCFDMRTIDAGDNVCFANVQGLATSLDVLLKRWFLYGSHAAYRQAETSH